ncbi:MAG: DinB family protein [Trueperaceae bacterium]|nr:DinB family protein [Trueperaceae bacterium]
MPFVDVAAIRETLEFALLETFESGKDPTAGTMYLDKKSGFFDSIDQLSAEDASRQVIPGGTTIVAQVYHSLFYLQVLERYMQGHKEKANWDESWQVRELDEAGWSELKTKLKTAYQRIRDYFKTQDDWEQLETGFPIVIHTAYHLGAIRQMLKLI